MKAESNTKSTVAARHAEDTATSLLLIKEEAPMPPPEKKAGDGPALWNGGSNGPYVSERQWKGCVYRARGRTREHATLSFPFRDIR